MFARKRRRAGRRRYHSSAHVQSVKCLIEMSRTIEKIWLFPLILALAVILSFAAVLVGLFPMPYYLGLVIPYLVVGNLGLIAYVGAKHRKQLLKVSLVSIISLGLAYLWVTQTA